MPNYAEWVSTLALALGAGNLTWQVARARREQPVISVDGQWAVSKRGDQNWGDGDWCLPVHVTNAGGQAVSVVDVYWELQVPAGPVRVRSADMGPPVPTRLEALSAASWEARAGVRGTRWNGLSARPAADVVLGKGLVTVYGAIATLRVPDEDPGGTRTSDRD